MKLNRLILLLILLVALAAPLMSQAQSCSELFEAARNKSVPFLLPPPSSDPQINELNKKIGLLMEKDIKTVTVEEVRKLYFEAREMKTKNREELGFSMLVQRLYIYEIERQADSKTRERIEGFRLSFLRAHNQEEDLAIYNILKGILESKRPLSSEVNRNIEYERRINIPTIPLSFDIKLPAADSELTETVRNIRELVRSLFIYNSLVEDSNVALKLAPLESDSSHYHSGWLKRLDPDYSPPNNEYAESMKINYGFYDNYYFGDFWYTHQKEESDYFDTPGKDLEKRKIALRVKTWINPKTGKVTARSAFIKITGNSTGFWTERDERYVKLDPNDTSSDLATLKKLLNDYLGENEFTDQIGPIKKVDNDRYAFNINWRDFKIGFITIDQFPTGDGFPRHSTLQLEIELLPEWMPLYLKYKAQFDSYFLNIEKRYGGKVTVVPKYLQTTEHATTGLTQHMDPAILKKHYPRSSKKYKTLVMPDNMRGDDIEENVIYLTPEEHAQSQIYVYKGLLYDSEGRLLNTLAPGGDKYIMDENGNFFTHNNIKNHSAVNGGQPAALAGHIKSENGVLLEINNFSGHYAPPSEYLIEGVSRLNEMGIDTSNVRVEFFGR